MSDSQLKVTEPQRVESASPFEGLVGYCRAIRSGDFIAVSGTTAVEPDGSVHAPGDAYKQAKRCLEIIEIALRKLGADRTQVVRTRMFVTDISRWREFAKAHAELFDAHRPATSMLEVKSLIDPAMLIEIEADAIA